MEKIKVKVYICSNMKIKYQNHERKIRNVIIKLNNNFCQQFTDLQVEEKVQWVRDLPYVCKSI